MVIFRGKKGMRFFFLGKINGNGIINELWKYIICFFWYLYYVLLSMLIVEIFEK